MSYPVRRRITVVIVGVVAGALLVTGVGTLFLLRLQARQDTRRDLVQLATNVAHTAALIQRPLQLSGLRTFLRRTQDMAIVRVPPLPADRLPRGMTSLPADRLQAGETISGVRGGVAYAAVPFVGANGNTFAVAVTQPASKGGGATLYFLGSAAIALLVAAAAAEALSQRITHPLLEAEQATGRIAEGDLSVRVPDPAHASEEIVSLTDSINTMAANLERLRGTERQFLMSVSHDLRTPLTSIRGFAEALADGTATDTTRAADVIAAEARRLERLVHDLLDLAKLDASRFSLDVRMVDIVEVVEDTADGFVPAADQLGLTLVVHEPISLPDTGAPHALAGVAPPLASADPDRLAQVVANLIENAMKYAAATIEVAVWFRSTAVGIGTAQITVDDDGPGIPAGDLPHVFDRLWTGTGDQARQVGSGLGLAIVAELVTAMGGTIRAESPVPRTPTDPGAQRPGTRHLGYFAVVVGPCLTVVEGPTTVVVVVVGIGEHGGRLSGKTSAELTTTDSCCEPRAWQVICQEATPEESVVCVMASTTVHCPSPNSCTWVSGLGAARTTPCASTASAVTRTASCAGSPMIGGVGAIAVLDLRAAVLVQVQIKARGVGGGHVQDHRLDQRQIRRSVGADAIEAAGDADRGPGAVRL